MGISQGREQRLYEELEGFGLSDLLSSLTFSHAQFVPHGSSKHFMKNLLSHPDVTERCYAAYCLGKVQEEDVQLVLGALITGMGDRSGAVQNSVFDAMRMRAAEFCNPANHEYLGAAVSYTCRFLQTYAKVPESQQQIALEFLISLGKSAAPAACSAALVARDARQITTRELALTFLESLEDEARDAAAILESYLTPRYPELSQRRDAAPTACAERARVKAILDKLIPSEQK